MSSLANVRKIKGVVLKVDDLASSYIETSVINADMPGAPSAKIEITTSGDDNNIYDLGVPDPGTYSYDILGDLDDPFRQEMLIMKGGDARTFKYVLPAGTKDTLTFTAWVVDVTRAVAYNDVYRSTIILRVTGPNMPAWAAT